MSTAITLVNQTLIMFLLAGVGYFLFRTKRISLEGSKSLANILIYIVLPCVIVNGFLVERTTERMIGLLVSAAAAAILLVVAMVVSRLFFPKDAIASFSAAFSNAGFFYDRRKGSSQTCRRIKSAVSNRYRYRTHSVFYPASITVHRHQNPRASDGYQYPARHVYCRNLPGANQFG